MYYIRDTKDNMRTKENQTSHDSQVGIQANSLIDKGFNKIFVDLPGYAKPPTINGHIPDVFAQKILNGIITETAIIEIETEDTLSTPHTFMQHSVFKQYATSRPNTWFATVIAR